MKSGICLSALVIFASLLSSAVARSSAVRDCGAPKNKGHVCGAADKIRSKAKIQWYYDTETAMCLAFKYNGCGGNNNRFDTIHQCELRCIPEDYGWCALSKEAYKNKDGQTRICYGHDKNTTQACPPDYVCKMLAFFAVCCPKRSEELFEKNYRPRCVNGTVVKMDRGGYQLPVFGRSCDDDFCAANSQCVAQEILAFCCR
ncbi:unnamed protein product [Toxocara canis]|uniref:BPTI/Kunitz inhibitor domain-containing protein n=1 Tax=Toxocara canis TaxID=6265 RepID=A0A183UW57_TOXCA|nr:unnamed protein product [Toxocara canis]